MSTHREALIRALRQLGTGEVRTTVARRGSRGLLARIELSNPLHRNALSGKMMVELAEAMDRLEKMQDLSVVSIVGDGNFFCAGADLSVAKEIDGATMCEFMQETTTRLHNMPAISIACIRGGAVGGGTELATACDHRVIAGDAMWRSVHAIMGISPGWGGGLRLRKLVGRSTAIELLCSAKKLAADECAKVGLVDAVVPTGVDVEEAAMSKYAKYFDMPPTALRACKTALIASDTVGDASKALELELKVFSQVWGGKDNLEALSRAKSSSK